MIWKLQGRQHGVVLWSQRGLGSNIALNIYQVISDTFPDLFEPYFPNHSECRTKPHRSLSKGISFHVLWSVSLSPPNPQLGLRFCTRSRVILPLIHDPSLVSYKELLSSFSSEWYGNDTIKSSWSLTSVICRSTYPLSSLNLLLSAQVT